MNAPNTSQRADLNQHELDALYIKACSAALLALSRLLAIDREINNRRERFQ